jgi:hypothetical protein
MWFIDDEDRDWRQGYVNEPAMCKGFLIVATQLVTCNISQI